jgi:hypothetical protein
MITSGSAGNLAKTWSAAVVLMLVISSLLISLPYIIKNAEANSLVHDISNVQFEQTDHGRIIDEYLTWNGQRQTVDFDVNIPGIGALDEESWLGLYNLQDNYNFGGQNIADSFNLADGPDDYTVTPSDTPIYFRVNSPTMQQSVASYTNTGAGTGDPNDIRITQKTWTPAGSDWTIIEFQVTNLKAVPITGLEVAYHGYMSGYYNGFPPMVPAFSVSGPGNDGGDDRDQWYAAQGTYTVEDNNGAGTTMAFSSADPARLLNIYHGETFDLQNIVLAGTALPDDLTLYNSIQTAPAQLGVPDCNPIIAPDQSCNIRSMVGWNVDSASGPLAPGESVRLPMVIAFGTDPATAMIEVDNARAFYSTVYSKYMVTEVSDEVSPMVEVFNWNKPPIALGAGGLTVSPDFCASDWTGGSWTAANLATNTHEYYTLGGGDILPSTEGWTLTLCDAGQPVYNATYGQYGTAPDPIVGESSARIYDALLGEYTDGWTRDNSPTFGAQNDVPDINQNPEVVLNEIYFNPSNPADKFVELYYTGNTSLDITGYDIVADTVYDVPSGPDAILSVTNRYYHLREFEDPAFFSALTVAGDNVYLYDTGATPVLQDMAGWTTSHNIDTSMTRLPDGNGTFDGHDDLSSQNAGWVFDALPTYSIVLVTSDQLKWGDPNYFVWFSLNVTNLQAQSDCIDMITQSSPSGWTVELYESDMVTPLVDNEPAAGCPTADGIPDTGPLAPNTPYWMYAKVYLSSSPQAGVEFTYVFGQSSLDTLGRGKAFLRTLVNPWINPDSYIEDPPYPTTIYEKAAGALGFTNETVVTLNGSGMGFSQYTGQDVIFAIDSSGSMEWNDRDPNGPCNSPVFDPGPPPVYRPARVDAAWSYVDNLTGSDRGGYVDFDGFSSLRVPLALGTMADNYMYLKQDPFNGLWCSDQVGGTFISGGLSTANQELVNNGDPKHVKVQILLTDAEAISALDDTQSRAAADFAAANEILIFTIGLNVTTPGPPGGVDLLDYIATRTGGQFFPAPDASALSDIFAQILDLVRSVAGYNPKPGTPGMMIEYVLEQNIDFIPGTFQLVPGTLENDPVPDSVVYNPTNTTLRWNWTLDQVNVGEYWAIRFNISSTVLGINVPVNMVPDSSITYMTANGINVTGNFPLVTINVIPPGLQPYINNVSIVPGAVNLTWDTVTGAELYRVYGGTSQTDIKLGMGDLIATIAAPQTWWLDTTNLPLYDEFYYVIRAVDTGTIPETRSRTSNTVGFFRTQFATGLNTFSIPLEPFFTQTLSSYMGAIPGATEISWLDSNDDWQTFPNTPVTPLGEVGKGYVIQVSSNTSYVFAGEPAAMLLYQDGFGFDNTTRDDLSATVDMGGNVTLGWTTIPGAEYYVYWSSSRDGFFTGSFSILNGGLRVASPPYVDVGAAALPENYYMIMPFEIATGTNGSSSYSIGVWTTEYNGNEMIGLPLRPIWGDMSADWYADQVTYCLGLVYLENGIWKAHFKEFPEGVYDTIIEHGRGYEITVYDTSIYPFIGW